MSEILALVHPIRTIPDRRTLAVPGHPRSSPMTPRAPLTFRSYDISERRDDAALTNFRSYIVEGKSSGEITERGKKVR